MYKLSDEAKRDLFTSKRVHSDIADAYVEIGLWRVIEYYEHTESDISFPELFERSLVELTNYKNHLILEDKNIPYELLFEIDTKARDYTLQLDKQYMIFKNLIAKSELSEHKKKLADHYLDVLDIANHDRFKKYILEVFDVDDL